MNHTVGIIGCGQMGQGIAQVSAVAGHKVFLYDSFKGIPEKAQDAITVKLNHLKDKQKLQAEQVTNALKNLTVVESLEALSDCDLIIEAVKEDYEIKQALFEQLSPINPHGIIATNTSSLSITKIGHVVFNPERFIGLHFMNPVPVMPLIEMISTDATNSQTLDFCTKFCQSINKTVVQCKDQPGFIVNRILIPMINQAICALESGLTSPEDIDTAMKLGANFPMGPLELADFIGLDTCLAILETLEKDGKFLTFPPSALLVQKVQEGKLGRKTKEGFFTY